MSDAAFAQATGLQITSVSKTFGDATVLHGVSLDVSPGEVRALVGQNGSGKSTLIKILAGVYEPDDGATVRVAGEELVFGSPRASESAGMRFVHQDLGLIDDLSIVDNLALGNGFPTTPWGAIRMKRARRDASAALRSLGYEIDVRRKITDLAMSERTAIAIARAMPVGDSGARVLVLDEPSANLPAAEVDNLFALVRRVSSAGIAVLFVSHHFDEVFGLADTATVLRDGHAIATVRTSEVDVSPELVELMVGRRVAAAAVERPAVSHEQAVVPAARGVGGRVLDDFDLDVRSGEIVGVAGITGSGREELARLLFDTADRAGVVRIDGNVIAAGSPTAAIRSGMGLVPAERRTYAGFLESTLRENITIPDPARHFRRARIDGKAEKRDVAAWLELLDVRPPRTETAFGVLSGGNQQKVVMARWLRQRPKVLVLDEPTQGVDIAAKADIHTRIAEAATNGVAVLVASTDHEELALLCDRVVVLRNGRIATVAHAPDIDPDALTIASIGRSRTG